MLASYPLAVRPADAPTAINEFPKIHVDDPATCLPAPALELLSDLYRAVLSGRKATTLRAYAGDLADFGRWMEAPSPAAALDTLVSYPSGLANACALAYRGELTDRGLAPATIARRLAALRSATRIARTLGKCAWSLDVESPRAEAYRDTSGPGRDGWKLIAAEANAGATDPRGLRDRAIVRLLHDCALRRGEVCSLDREHYDPARGVVWVLGKGRSGRAPITLPPATRLALGAWGAFRGVKPGALFHRLDRGTLEGPPERLAGETIRRVVARLAKGAGCDRRVRPHGLRHQGITRALDATNGDVRKVAKFSRHKKIETLLIYDDARRDLAGEVAGLVAGED